MLLLLAVCGLLFVVVRCLLSVVYCCVLCAAVLVCAVCYVLNLVCGWPSCNVCSLSFVACVVLLVA